MLNKDELRDSVLMVFSNKQDLSNATSAAEMTDKLGLQCLCSTGLSWCIVPRWVTSSMKWARDLGTVQIFLGYSPDKHNIVGKWHSVPSRVLVVRQ
uniref:Uncharacterized protein n=1 Tax=Hyaloperonospora arabidopsidis (strain Emoy2) TaxID=559515 RepID=M4BGN1_HYAAE